MLNLIDYLALACIPPLAILFLVLAVDDFIIDSVAWLMGLKPQAVHPRELVAMRLIPEKRFAVMIAAWKESDVIQQMVRGNLQAVDYDQYVFFIGIYPNDRETATEVQILAHKFPGRLHIIENALPGPTCKGQMLNEVVRGIFKHERQTGLPFDALLIHDAEDVMHPQSLRLLNRELNSADFVQIPVFSQSVKGQSLIAGTYMDEFAESHTKDLLVREHLGASVPSAGVGTAISRELVLAATTNKNGRLFNESSLTEDYELGMSAGELGFRGHFACYHLGDESNPDFIATREHFPRTLWQSIRQKTRWTVGIAFQGTENIGWKGTLIQRLFLYRDRKGPISNLAGGAGILLLAYTAVRSASGVPGPLLHNPFGLQGLPIFFEALLFINLLLMSNRLLQRAICSTRVYGLASAPWSLLRVPVSNLVNAISALRATALYLTHLLTGKPLSWAKTHHELPKDFGRVPDTSEENCASTEAKAG